MASDGSSASSTLWPARNLNLSNRRVRSKRQTTLRPVTFVRNWETNVSPIAAVLNGSKDFPSGHVYLSPKPSPGQSSDERHGSVHQSPVAIAVHTPVHESTRNNRGDADGDEDGDEDEEEDVDEQIDDVTNYLQTQKDDGVENNKAPAIYEAQVDVMVQNVDVISENVDVEDQGDDEGQRHFISENVDEGEQGHDEGGQHFEHDGVDVRDTQFDDGNEESGNLDEQSGDNHEGVIDEDKENENREKDEESGTSFSHNIHQVSTRQSSSKENEALEEEDSGPSPKVSRRRSIRHQKVQSPQPAPNRELPQNVRKSTPKRKLSDLPKDGLFWAKKDPPSKSHHAKIAPVETVTARQRPGKNIATPGLTIVSPTSNDVFKTPCEPAPRKKKVPIVREEEEMQSKTLRLWCVSGSRNLNDAMDLDVASQTIEEVGAVYRQRLPSKVCRKAVKHFVSETVENIQEKIDLAGHVRKLKSSVTKANSKTNRLRKNLLLSHQDGGRLRADLAEMKESNNADLERSDSIRKINTFLKDLQDLNERYRATNPKVPRDKDFQHPVNTPALLAEAGIKHGGLKLSEIQDSLGKWLTTAQDLR